ncbi:hypothetical protein NQ318_000674 [Aromia moschata]|uniref:Uncharacterized protein n=1 Tax=Aromia moschata TaxID=1265417 RepID=A0AAV8XVP4_9CUCU|nr:hypothetical protein NQ318_000674 [Aromia moschata]
MAIYREQYRYLGVCQDGRINHTQLKKEFQEKYKSRVTKLLNTLLSGGNRIKAINSWAVPVLTYSFGIVKWSVTDLDELDRLTRRLLTKFRDLHTNSSVIRLYLPRRRGGRGLLNIKNQCLNQEASLRRKLLTNRDPLITAVAREDAGYTPLSLGCELIPVDVGESNFVYGCGKPAYSGYAWGSKVGESNFALGTGNPAYPSYARRSKVGESNFVYGCGKPAYSGYAWGARSGNPAYPSCARRSKVSEGNFVFGCGNPAHSSQSTKEQAWWQFPVLGCGKPAYFSRRRNAAHGVPNTPVRAGDLHGIKFPRLGLSEEWLLSSLWQKSGSCSNWL